MIRRNECGSLIIEWQVVVGVLVITSLVTVVQVFVALSIKKSTDQIIKDAVATAIVAHDHDASAHDNLRLLNEVEQRQRAAIERSSLTRAIVTEQEARMDRMQVQINQLLARK